MSRSFKLVAFLLALALFGTPLLALANCNPKFAMSGHCGGEDCPMMMESRQTAATHVSGAPSGEGSCCRAAGLPDSVVKPAALQAKTLVEPVTPDSITAVVPVGSSKVQALPALRLNASSSFQAVLCIFLV